MNDDQTYAAESLPQPVQVWDSNTANGVTVLAADGFMYRIDTTGEISSSWDHDPETDGPGGAWGVFQVWNGEPVAPWLVARFPDEDAADAFAWDLVAADRSQGYEIGRVHHDGRPDGWGPGHSVAIHP